MKTDTQRDGDLLIYTLNEERADARMATGFKDSLGDLVAEGGFRAMILDLTPVKFMDSSMLGAIIAVYKLVGDDKEMRIVVPEGPVGQLFRLTRMDRVFKLFDTLPEAR